MWGWQFKTKERYFRRVLQCLETLVLTSEALGKQLVLAWKPTQQSTPAPVSVSSCSLWTFLWAPAWPGTY